MTVTSVARDPGINRSMLFAWCRLLRAEAGSPETSSAPTFVPVVAPDPVGFVRASPPAAGTGPGTIEISFTHLPQMQITGGVDLALAIALVAALAPR